MRFLDQAIEEKLYETSEAALRAQTWKEFETAADKTPVYLFGTGEGADFALNACGNNVKFAGAVDNDTSKWDRGLCEYVSYPVGKELKVNSPDKLKEISKECVVLITSIRYCDDINAQLKEMGIRNIYSLLHMEANRRKEEQTDTACDVVDEKKEYAKACLKKEISSKKVILARDGLGGHGKQIFLKLAEMRPDLDLVWITEKNISDVIDGVRIIAQSDWKAYIEELETAKVWIYGDMIPEFAVKRPEQIYIHVKHWASITLKSFYFHMTKHMETKSIYDYYRHNTDAMDYCMVGSDFDEDTCRSGFDFDGEFVRVGSPRSDVLFKEGVREKVYEKLSLRPDVHTVLYAPTFRSVNQKALIGHMRDVDLDFDMLRDALTNRFGGEWVILLRIHPDVAIESNKVETNSFVYNASYYDDSQELVAASDVLISDYSSIMFEPAFVNKPVFLYAPDADEYISNDRALLLDYYSLPFDIAKDNEELSNIIIGFDENNYLNDVKSFLNKYGVSEDGHSAERAAKFISELIDP